MTSTAASTPRNGHLAASGGEDYFRAVNQGTELDDALDHGILSNQSNRSISKRKHESEEDDDDDNEESRYNFDKKNTGSQKKSWRDSSSEKRTNGQNVESGNESSDSDMSMSGESEDHSESIINGVEPEEGEILSLDDSDEQENGKDDTNDALDEHVLEIGSAMEDGTDADNNYDLDTELGHLEDKDFKVRTLAKQEDTSVEGGLSKDFYSRKWSGYTLTGLPFLYVTDHGILGKKPLLHGE